MLFVEREAGILGSTWGGSGVYLDCDTVNANPVHTVILLRARGLHYWARLEGDPALEVVDLPGAQPDRARGEAASSMRGTINSGWWISHIDWMARHCVLYLQTITLVLGHILWARGSFPRLLGAVIYLRRHDAPVTPLPAQAQRVQPSAAELAVRSVRTGRLGSKTIPLPSGTQSSPASPQFPDGQLLYAPQYSPPMP